MRFLPYPRRVFLQGHEILKRIHLRKTTGMDEAHEEIADICAVKSTIKQAILPMTDGHLEGLFTNVVIQRRPFNSEEER